MTWRFVPFSLRPPIDYGTGRTPRFRDSPEPSSRVCDYPVFCRFLLGSSIRAIREETVLSTVSISTATFCDPQVAADLLHCEGGVLVFFCNYCIGPDVLLLDLTADLDSFPWTLPTLPAADFINFYDCDQGLFFHSFVMSSLQLFLPLTFPPQSFHAFLLQLLRTLLPFWGLGLLKRFVTF